MNDESLLNISNRMKNDFYVGVVGAVRSGKSSFINSFFKQMILPYINDEFVKHKIVDELPQSAAGKQIMTVEPKFIPSTSALIELNNTKISIRLVDCVGEIIPSSDYKVDSEYEDAKIIFNEVIQKLPTEQQNLINMYYKKDMTKKEIADTLVISPMSVTRRMKQAFDVISTMILDESERRMLKNQERS